MLSCSVLAASLAAGQVDVSRAVNFAHSGAPLGRLLPDLGAEAGVEFDIQEAAAREVVALRIDGRPLGEVLDRVGAVTGTRWFAQGSKIRVIVDLEGRRLAQEQRSAARREELARARESLAYWMQRRSSGESGEDYSPSIDTRLVNSLALGLPDSVFLGLELGERVVFSTSPTATQRPMPRFDQSLLNAWIAAHNSSVRAAREAQAAGGDDDELGPFREFAKEMEALFGSRREAQEISSGLSKLNLVVEMANRFERLPSVRLRGYDAAGNVVLESRAVMEPSRRMNEGEPDESGEGGGPRFEGLLLEMSRDETKVTLSAEAESHFAAKFNVSQRVTGPGAAMTARVREVVSRPDVYEPLALEYGEALVAVAEKRGLQLVACLPDSVVDSFTPASGTVGEVVQRLDSESIALEVKDGWFRVWPEDMALEWETRAVRESLAAVLSVAVETGSVPLDTLAEFAFANPSGEGNSLVSDRLRLLAPQGGSAWGGDAAWSVLRLYGSLPRGARAALRRGERILFSSLSGAARAELTRFLFETGSEFSRFDATSPRRRVGLLEQAFLGDMGWGGGGSFLNEPTEVMPSGVPSQGYLAAMVEESDYLTPVGADGGVTPMSTSLGPEELAFFRLLVQTPGVTEQEGFAESMQIFENMGTGRMALIQLSFVVSPGVERLEELRDVGPLERVGRFGLNQMPPGLLARVKEEEDVIKRSPFFRLLQVFGGMGGSGMGSIRP